MKDKFTKGPWKAFENSAGMFEVCCQDKNDLSADDISIYSATVCMVCNVTYSLDENKNPEANAHLIAAAPEMYEMLESKLDLIRCGIGSNYSGDPKQNPKYLEVVELLAKARGEHGNNT